MQDTVIKGNGKSRIIKGPTDMPSTYEEWRSQVIAGTAKLDVSVNPDTSDSGGISQLGTPLNKENLLTDIAASMFGLGDDATIDQMFKALMLLRGAKNGFASLDTTGKVPSGQLPSMDYIPLSQKGQANGVATLGNDGKIPSEQSNVSVTYIPENRFQNGGANITVSGYVFGKMVILYIEGTGKPDTINYTVSISDESFLKPQSGRNFINNIGASCVDNMGDPVENGFDSIKVEARWSSSGLELTFSNPRPIESTATLNLWGSVCYFTS